MNREAKIKILTAIKSGKLPIKVLSVSPGVYRHIENGVYKKETFEISYQDLLKSCDVLGYSVTLLYFENKEKPYSVWVSLVSRGGKKQGKIDTTVTVPKYDVIDWVEIKTHDIELADREAAENLSSFFEKE